jgi:hypothetical protein
LSLFQKEEAAEKRKQVEEVRRAQEQKKKRYMIRSELESALQGYI